MNEGCTVLMMVEGGCPARGSCSARADDGSEGGGGLSGADDGIEGEGRGGRVCAMLMVNGGEGICAVLMMADERAQERDNPAWHKRTTARRSEVSVLP